MELILLIDLKVGLGFLRIFQGMISILVGRFGGFLVFSVFWCGSFVVVKGFKI